jgi:hypothetical protein
MVEQAIEDVPPDQCGVVYSTQLARLNEIEEKVNRISIPLSFADELYGLRSHINFVRKRIVSSIETDANAGLPPRPAMDEKPVTATT